MIFTVHDINLMDCKRMFRKEQIWFVHKDEEGVYVYSLADFTAQKGVRDTTDVMEKYRREPWRIARSRTNQFVVEYQR